MSDMEKRLRKVIELAEAALAAKDDLIAALRAQSRADTDEIERLRAALDMKFPTMLRKMWSGQEVQKWLDDRAREALEAKDE